MFKAFESSAQSHSIHDLTLEGDVDRVNIYGNLQITKDQDGLKTAKILQAFLNQMVATLESQTLPEKIKIEESGEIENPFL